MNAVASLIKMFALMIVVKTGLLMTISTVCASTRIWHFQTVQVITIRIVLSGQYIGKTI